eukprot:1150020-Pleurochrysis_carterae.AAC.1
MTQRSQEKFIFDKGVEELKGTFHATTEKSSVAKKGNCIQGIENCRKLHIENDKGQKANGLAMNEKNGAPKGRPNMTANYR